MRFGRHCMSRLSVGIAIWLAISRWNAGALHKMRASALSSMFNRQKSMARTSLVAVSSRQWTTPRACSIVHALVMSDQHTQGVMNSSTYVARMINACTRAGDGSISSLTSLNASHRFLRSFDNVATRCVFWALLCST